MSSHVPNQDDAKMPLHRQSSFAALTVLTLLGALWARPLSAQDEGQVQIPLSLYESMLRGPRLAGGPEEYAALAESFCDRGRETLLFMEENLISDQTVERFLARRHGDTRAALTILLWQHDPPIMPAGAQVYSRLLRDGDGQLVFSRALAKQSIWPAIDPLQSTSRVQAQINFGRAPSQYIRMPRPAPIITASSRV